VYETVSAGRHLGKIIGQEDRKEDEMGVEKDE
jgi:hypothetical protein